VFRICHSEKRCGYRVTACEPTEEALDKLKRRRTKNPADYRLREGFGTPSASTRAAIASRVAATRKAANRGTLERDAPHLAVSCSLPIWELPPHSHCLSTLA
jgi:hypothetical protein